MWNKTSCIYVSRYNVIQVYKYENSPKKNPSRVMDASGKNDSESINHNGAVVHRLDCKANIKEHSKAEIAHQEWC